MMRRYFTIPLLLGLGAILVTALLVGSASLFRPLSAAADDPPPTPVVVELSQPSHGGELEIGNPRAEYFAGETISLIAKPDSGWKFAGWSTTPTGLILEKDIRLLEVDIEIPVDTPKITISGSFIFCYTLNTISQGGTIGVAVSKQKDINPPVCDPSPPNYARGTILDLLAEPALGYDFVGWSSNVTGSTELAAITMAGTNSLIEVTATFNKGCRQLKLESGLGGGDPTAPTRPNSPDCDPGFYKGGEVIPLSAHPSAGWRVKNWVGTDSGTNTVTMPFLLQGDSHTVTVNYVQKPILQFSSTGYTFPEFDKDNPGGAVLITVERTGNSYEAASVDFLIAPGSAILGDDYEANPTSGTLQFANSINSKTFAIKILDDTLREGDETIKLSLINKSSNAVYGSRDTATLIINDDETPATLQFETSDYTVTESDSGSTVTQPVTINLVPPSAKTVWVSVRTEAVTASPGEDYVSIAEKEIPFRPGHTSETINVEIKGDNLSESEETFRIVLFSPTNAGLGTPSSATIRIEDNDESPAVQFSKDEYFAMVGDIQKEVTIELNEASGQTVAVDYSVTKINGGSPINSTLFFSPGETSRDLFVNLSGAVHGDQFLLQLSSAENATLGPLSSADLFVLNTTPNDCHWLNFGNTGYGLPPLATSPENSLGCQVGQYVAGELINVTARPDAGWNVARWHGTENDTITSLENVVVMPDVDHVVSADYVTNVFLAMIKKFDFFIGTQEVEPNDTFVLANGPLQPGKTYSGKISEPPGDIPIEDRFYFIVKETSDVTISLKDIPQDRDYDLFLYKEDWSKGHEAESVKGGNDAEEIKKKLAPGKYYVSVYSANNKPSSSNYKLKVIFETS